MKWIRRKLLNLALRHVFNALTEEEILPWGKIPGAKKDILIAEARMISQSDLWRRLVNTTTRKADKMMFEKAVNWDDMVFGKATLYVIDILDKRITALSKLNT